MPRANLKQLSRRFARGMLEKTEYRRQRAEFIESLMADSDSDCPSTGTSRARCGDGDADADTEVPLHHGRFRH